MKHALLVIKKAQDLRPFYYSLLVFALSILATLVAELIRLILLAFNIGLEDRAGPGFMSLGAAGALFAACIVAPLLETFFAQALPIKLTQRFLGVTGSVICSATIFSLMHYYSILYMMHTFLLGLVFATGYVLWRQHERIHPFWLICIAHSCRNLLTFLLHLIEKQS
jgi:membrane protease YdiL (CAAX protease family)